MDHVCALAATRANRGRGSASLLLAALGLLGGCSAFDAALLERDRDPSDAGTALDGSTGDEPAADGGPTRDASPPGDGGTDGRADGGTGDAATDSGAGHDDRDAGVDEDAGSAPTPPEDLCPDDPDKLAPGSCGCGESEDFAATCDALAGGLVHRYRLSGDGTTAVDSASGADGTLVNATLDGSAALTLPGGTSDAYVDLPDGIVSARTDATVEVWLDWAGGNSWQRVFDFGTSNGGAGTQGSGTTYLFFTPSASDGAMRAAFSLDGFMAEKQVIGSAALMTGLHHVALVFVDQGEMRLYVDGALEGSVMLASGDSLSAITDDNNWIGRSQFASDDELGAVVHEVRIHGVALSADDVAASYALGADPPFLP